MTPRQRNKLADRWLPRVRSLAARVAARHLRRVGKWNEREMAADLFDALWGPTVTMAAQAREETRKTLPRMKKDAESALAFDNEEFVGELKAWLKEVTRKSSKSLARKWRDKLEKIHEDMAGQRASYGEIAAIFIEEEIPGTQAWAEMTARTNTIWSMNEGAVLAYEEAGAKALEWDNSEDSDVCPFCDEMGGAVVKLGDPFVPAGETLEAETPEGKGVELTPIADVMHPPLHPNCRCAAMPVF